MEHKLVLEVIKICVHGKALAAPRHYLLDLTKKQ